MLTESGYTLSRGFYLLDFYLLKRLTLIMGLLSLITLSFVSLSLMFLFIDSLFVRFEIKTFFKALGFAVFGTYQVMSLLNFMGSLIAPNQVSWIGSVGLYLIFISLIFDPHSKLNLAFILPPILFILFGGHTLLALQAFLVSVSTFQLAYTTHHKDLIPFGVGFVLVAIGEFFLSLGENFLAASAIIFILASAYLFYWLWQYLVIRLPLLGK